MRIVAPSRGVCSATPRKSSPSRAVAVCQPSRRSQLRRIVPSVSSVPLVVASARSSAESTAARRLAPEPAAPPHRAA